MSINKFFFFQHLNFFSNLSANSHVKAALPTTSPHFTNCNSAPLINMYIFKMFENVY